MLRSKSRLALLCILLGAGACAGNRGADTSAPELAEATNAEVAGEPILFRPKLHRDDGSSAQRGIGFVIVHNNRSLGVMSSHAMLEGSVAVRSVDVLPMRVGGTGNTLASTDRSFGVLGFGPGAIPPGRLSVEHDYAFVAFDEPPKGIVPLRLDVRSQPQANEQVWVAVPDRHADNGFAVNSGYVSKFGDAGFEVTLDGAVTGEGLSGAPVVSKTTDDVVGMVSTVNQDQGKTIVKLVRAVALRKALEDSGGTLVLRRSWRIADALARSIDNPANMIVRTSDERRGGPSVLTTRSLGRLTKAMVNVARLDDGRAVVALRGLVLSERGRLPDRFLDDVRETVLRTKTSRGQVTAALLTRHPAMLEAVCPDPAIALAVVGGTVRSGASAPQVLAQACHLEKYALWSAEARTLDLGNVLLAHMMLEHLASRGTVHPVEHELLEILAGG